MSPLTLCVLLLGAEPPSEQPPPPPYQLVVCLRVADHPLLTPAFVESVRREVRDQMRSLFGPLATVDVLTRGHWLIDEGRGRGVEYPVLAAEAWNKLAPNERAFLMTLDYRSNHYRLAWRQIDPLRRYQTPPRVRETPDRQWVARAICLAIKGDFSLVASVEPNADSTAATLTCLGHEHPLWLNRLLGEEGTWVVYEVVKLRNGGVERRPINNTVLMWRKQAGALRAEVESNAKDPFKRRSSIEGFEALRLATQTGRIQLQLIDEKSGAPLANCTVYANDRGFDAFSDEDILARPDRSGLVISHRDYNHVAYVRVSQGNWNRRQLPIPLIDTVTTHVIRLAGDPQSFAKSDLERRLRFLGQDLAFVRRQQDDVVRETNQMNEERRYEDLLQRWNEYQSLVQSRLAGLQADLGKLLQEARGLKMEVDGPLAEIEKGAKFLEERHLQLGRLRTATEGEMKVRDANARATRHIEVASAAKLVGDYDEVIAQLELALTHQPDLPKVQQELGQLKAKWAIRDDSHRLAREFVLKTWQMADNSQLEALIDQAEKHLATCQRVGDWMTGHRFLRLAESHRESVSGLIDDLAARGTPEDEAERAKFLKVVERIALLEQKYEPFVSAGRNADTPVGAPDAAEGETASPLPATPPARTPPKSAAEEEEEPPVKRP